jgi:ABC-type methionine transport system ATPase subunit
VSDAGAVVVSLRSVVKDYRGLRPLRVKALDLAHAESKALIGLDREAAQVLVDLITGSTVPDAGQVIAFGRDTRDIPNADAWLTSLERFGLFSERTVFVEQFTAEQNLAIPLSLAVESLSDDVRARVRGLADEVGLSPAELSQVTETLTPPQRARLRLGRTLALGPDLLLLEHPTATLQGGDVAAFADTVTRIVERRRLSVLVLTAEKAFARDVARTVLTWQPGSGELTPESGWRRWFS